MREETPRRFFIYLLLTLLPPVLTFTPSLSPTCLYKNPLIIALASAGIVIGVMGIIGAWANREVVANFLKRLAVLGILANIAILWYFMYGPGSSVQTQYLMGVLVGLSDDQPFYVLDSSSRLISLEYTDRLTSIGVSHNTDSVHFILVDIPSNGCVFKQNGDTAWFTTVHEFQWGQHVLVTWKGPVENTYPAQISPVNVFILDDQ